jgi:hypothetical protein
MKSGNLGPPISLRITSNGQGLGSVISPVDKMVHWEHGSNFHWPELREGLEAFVPPAGARMMGSGRIALCKLLEFGFNTRGWRRLWVPSYYCEDVVTSLQGSRVSIARYPCGPLREAALPTAAEGDVLLRLDYFGWGLRPLKGSWGGETIEDRTHDPFAQSASTADFVIASLRKTLPLPDGGICWSPRGLPLPRPPDPAVEHEHAVMQRLAAMALKRAYLLGSTVLKETYRELESGAEQAFLEGIAAPISEISRLMLQHFPVAAARAARGTNFAIFRQALAEDPRLTVLGPAHQEAPAVAVVRVSEVKLRDELRARLAEEGIYTAILWPVPENGASWHTEEDAEFAASTLAVHVDSRYRPEDMERVAEQMRSLSRALLGVSQ